jgi:hypothetical protein
MSDGEFWEHVFIGSDHSDDEEPPEVALGPLREPCGDCGSVGACAWDAEGRPLVHPVSEDWSEC